MALGVTRQEHWPPWAWVALGTGLVGVGVVLLVFRDTVWRFYIAVFRALRLPRWEQALDRRRRAGELRYWIDFVVAPALLMVFGVLMIASALR